MRFKLDENLPALARQRIVDAGWDVDDVHEEGLAGAEDDAIRALTTERITASLWVVEPGRVRIRDHPTGA